MTAAEIAELYDLQNEEEARTLMQLAGIRPEKKGREKPSYDPDQAYRAIECIYEKRVLKARMNLMENELRLEMIRQKHGSGGHEKEPIQRLEERIRQRSGCSH